MSILFVVATPIGNMEDITLRALRVLGEVPLIAAEDTRTARKLLSHHGISAPRLLSYNDRNRRQRTPQILALLESGDAALISEAGTPAISDPGVHLVEAVTEAGHDVVPLPGASAVVTALAAAGLPVRSFRYVGFLPRQSGARRRILAELEASPDTIVAFEAPHRLRKALIDIDATLGERRLIVCRELTKRFEEIFRGSAEEALDHFDKPRGEFTLVIEGFDADGTQPHPQEAIDVDAALLELREEGMRARDAVRTVTERSGLPHRHVYGRWLALAEQR
jgi:16S rRNA (cytidine1402-2'-O)-methyltransferase